jgi:hypothetical protein
MVQVLKVLKMGKFGNALQRIRRGLPKMDFVKHKHRECVNFDNGTCKAAPRIFDLKNLNPEGPACPHFKARKIEKPKNEER